MFKRRLLDILNKNTRVHDKERIWVDPNLVQLHSTDRTMMQWMGRERGGDWDLQFVGVEEYPKAVYCRKRWVLGQSWEAAGAYDFVSKLVQKSETGVIDGCRTEADIVARFDRLDELFETVRFQKFLSSRTFKRNGVRREKDGIRVHIGRCGSLMTRGGGTHRLAMARILELPIVPASLGVVHEDAIPFLQELRKQSKPWNKHNPG